MSLDIKQIKISKLKWNIHQMYRLTGSAGATSKLRGRWNNTLDLNAAEWLAS
jgi:hypothetical protein